MGLFKILTDLSTEPGISSPESGLERTNNIGWYRVDSVSADKRDLLLYAVATTKSELEGFLKEVDQNWKGRFEISNVTEAEASKAARYNEFKNNGNYDLSQIGVFLLGVPIKEVQ